MTPHAPTRPAAAPAAAENHALDHQQSHDPVTRRAEREAQAQFRCPRDTAREQDAGHVETRDDQDESDEREEQGHEAIHNRADANWNSTRSRNPETVTAIGVGILALEITGDTRHLGSGLIDREAVLEASDPHQPLPASQPDAPKVTAVRVHRHWDPEALLIDGISAELRRRDANDRERTAVQMDGLSDDTSLAAELCLPEPVTDDG